jgi:hypothetical protein
MEVKHSILRASVGIMAHATITFDLGNHPQPDEHNILFGAPETGMTIHGAVGGIDVVCSSTVDTLFQKAEGQAEIFNTSKPPLANLTDLTVTPAESFTDFIVDLNKANGSTLDITVDGFDGTTPETNTFSFAGKNGSNFITILALGGAMMVLGFAGLGFAGYVRLAEVDDIADMVIFLCVGAARATSLRGC